MARLTRLLSSAPFWIVALGLAHGLLYVFLMPPWQHYDEPTNFEYAWLLANRPGLPQPGDYDNTMRRAVAESMLAHGFFRGMDFRPDLNVQDQPIPIGFSQLNDRPLYYFLASLPLRLIPSANITVQLYAARLVSLALFLLSLMAAWGTMSELAPSGHALRWLVPLSMALLPGYVDVMTAVNNDVGAAAFFTLFLWAVARLVHRGLSLGRVLGAASAAALCLLTKSTVYLALPLLGLALIFAVLGARRRRLAWGVMAILAFGLSIMALTWGEPLFWVRSPSTLSRDHTRTNASLPPLGEHAFRLQINPNQVNASLYQILPAAQIQELRGKTATLGAWVWATKPLTGRVIAFRSGSFYSSQVFQVSPTPAFLAFQVNVPDDAQRGMILLNTADWQKTGDSWEIYFDGVVLVNDARPLDVPPQFTDAQAQSGLWDGRPFTNLLRNASAEKAGPGVRPWLERARAKLSLPLPSIALMVDSILDWPVSGWYYRLTAANLLRTFWAQLGWGHVPLHLPFTGRPYRLLAAITLAGLGGAWIALWRWRASLPWSMLFLLGLALSAAWGQALLRGLHSLTDMVFIPSARYAFPAILPTLLVLNAGWWTLLGVVRLPHRLRSTLCLLFFLGLDAAAIHSIVRFYIP